jgi:exopolysaccharide biosynthesis polyprenyl glycosylphosphotransferase
VSEQLAPGKRLTQTAELPLWVGAPPRPPRPDYTWGLARAIADALMILTAALAAGAAIQDALAPAWQAVLVALLLAGFAATGSYRPRTRPRLDGELRRVLACTSLAVLTVAALATLTSGRPGVGDAMVAHWLLLTGLVVSGRVGIIGAQHALRPKLARMGAPTLIVGAGHVGQLAAKRLLDDPAIGMRPIGFLDKDPLDPDGIPLPGMPGLPILGASWDLERVVRRYGVEHVVIAFSTAPHHVLLGIVRECWRLGVSVAVVPRLFEVEGRRMEVQRLGALPLIGLHTTDPDGPLFAVKYAIDRILAALGLLALSPLIVVIALAIRFTMGGPILFRQQRVGRDGRVFDMLKFRTMRGDPGSAGEADASWARLMLSGVDVPDMDAPDLAGDDRRTPLGSLLRKLSLDELPQLFNVLRGDMSIIGPRPERVQYVRQFADAVYRYPDRHRVKSGLTGWAQVHGLRGETSLADRIEWDNFYIENWTPWLDLKIVVMTIPALLGFRGGE